MAPAAEQLCAHEPRLDPLRMRSGGTRYANVSNVCLESALNGDHLDPSAGRESSVQMELVFFSVICRDFITADTYACAANRFSLLSFISCLFLTYLAQLFYRTSCKIYHGSCVANENFTLFHRNAELCCLPRHLWAEKGNTRELTGRSMTEKGFYTVGKPVFRQRVMS